MMDEVEFKEDILIIKEAISSLLVLGQDTSEIQRMIWVNELIAYITGEEYYEGMGFDEVTVLVDIMMNDICQLLVDGDFDGFIDYIKNKLLEQERYEYLHELHL